MKVRLLQKSEEGLWDEFVQKHELGTIHQLSVWGRFQETVAGRGKYFIFVVEEGSRIVGGSLVVRHSLPRGMSWLYASRGPLGEGLEELTEELRVLAEKENAVFMRIDPPLRQGGVYLKGFREISEGFQPQCTLMVDLSLSEEEILAQMKPKGRYNVRVAEKKGVVVRESKDVEDFYKLLLETTVRDGFHGHPKKYYENMLKVLGDKACLYVAEYEGEVVAGAIVTYFGEVATYYYGVSGNKHRNVMAPYLLHFVIMKEAKEQGYKWYDLFGIAPAGAKNHPWAGVTEFKRKFGGNEVSYVKAQEFVFKTLWYWAYKLYKWVRKVV